MSVSFAFYDRASDVFASHRLFIDGDNLQGGHARLSNQYATGRFSSSTCQTRRHSYMQLDNDDKTSGRLTGSHSNK
jgi:hypothetical protein